MKKLLVSWPVVVIVSLSLACLCYYLYSLSQQDRVSVRNQSFQTISQMKVIFDGNYRKEVVFQDIPSQRNQWQLFSSRWGNAGSYARMVSAEGILADGKEIKFARQDIGQFRPFLFGERLYVTVHPNGQVEIPKRH